MENCFVKDLKGACTDNSILKVGELKVSVNLTASTTFTIRNSKAIQLRIVGNGTFSNNETTYDVAANTDASVTVSSGIYDIIIPEKYTLSKLIGPQSKFFINGEDIKYCPFTDFRATVSGNEVYDFLAKPNVFEVTCRDGFVFNIDSIDAFSAFNNSSLVVDTVGELSNLRKINKAQYIFVVSSPGTVESFIVARAARNTAGTFKQFYDANATLNSIYMTQIGRVDVIFNANGTASVVSNTTSQTICTYDGANFVYN